MKPEGWRTTFVPIEPDKIAIVHLTFAQYLSEQSPWSIAQELNGCGVHSPPIAKRFVYSRYPVRTTCDVSDANIPVKTKSDDPVHENDGAFTNYTLGYRYLRSRAIV